MTVFDDASEFDVRVLLEEREELEDAAREVTALSFTLALKAQSVSPVKEVRFPSLTADFSSSPVNAAGVERVLRCLLSVNWIDFDAVVGRPWPVATDALDFTVAAGQEAETERLD